MSSGRELPSLPIDAVRDEVCGAVAQHRAVVLVAEPGAGKTTRIPPALAEHLGGTVLVVEPRRLAARLAAARVAEELGCELGAEVGYEVRGDRKVSGKSRIIFVTDGVLRRKLLSGDALSPTHTIVFDEFHERRLGGDLALAIVVSRPAAPRVVVMSATLDPKPIAAFLRDAPVVECPGRTHPIEVRYQPGQRDWKLERCVRAALRDLLREHADGDVLVFLPGAAEIHRTREAISETASDFECEVVTLHGDLPPKEQLAAVRPNKMRRIILSTNVAESSVTVPRIRFVIDSGLARVARHSAWSGAVSLAVEPISQASATQRAGRAGRLGPGTCVRLFGEHEWQGRAPFDKPEVLRVDLAPACLEAAGIGGALHWFETPPAHHWTRARELLVKLGFIDGQAITELGRRALSLPIEPRAARSVLAAQDAGAAGLACYLGAFLSEGRPRGTSKDDVDTECDVLDDIDALLGSPRDRRYSQIRRTAEILARSLGCKLPRQLPAGANQTVRRSILLGYPDCVAKRDAVDRGVLKLVSGTRAVASSHTSVLSAPWLVAVEADERGAGSQRRTRVLRASAIEADWLIEFFEAEIAERDEHIWNASAGRVERISSLLYGVLALDESRSFERSSIDADKAGAIVAEQVLGRAHELEKHVAPIRDRARILRESQPELSMPDIDAGWVAGALRLAAAGCLTLSEFEERDVFDYAPLSGDQRRALQRLTPSHLSLPGRKRVPVNYEIDRPPWIQSRMQDFFGLRETPRIAEGRVPVVCHLLAPNRRAVQVTSDLDGFWERHYPELRRQLSRRYPKHFWPEDPLLGK